MCKIVNIIGILVISINIANSTELFARIITKRPEYFEAKFLDNVGDSANISI